MDAILLAAGQGRRFGGANPFGCKVLIEVEGACLLDRHLEALFGAGVDRVTLVVGYEAHRIRDHLRGDPRPISFVDNDRYTEGSLYSLCCARSHLRADDTMVMDADVLYDHRLITRLLGAPHASSLLYDAGFVDEEMKVGLREGRAVELGKKILREDYEGIGRGPGFYKFDRATGTKLAGILEDMVAEGLAGLEYEDAFNRLFRTEAVWPVDVGTLAWTEIDHAQDLARATNEIWPRIQAAGA